MAAPEICLWLPFNIIDNNNIIIIDNNNSSMTSYNYNIRCVDLCLLCVFPFHVRDVIRYSNAQADFQQIRCAETVGQAAHVLANSANNCVLDR